MTFSVYNISLSDDKIYSTFKSKGKYFVDFARLKNCRFEKQIIVYKSRANLHKN
jgi:hypothetical protein